MIKKVCIKKGFYTVVYSGAKPTKKEVYEFCCKKKDEMLNSNEYKLLIDIYNIVKRKFDNKQNQLEIYNRVINDAISSGKNESDEIWGS